MEHPNDIKLIADAPCHNCRHQVLTLVSVDRPLYERLSKAFHDMTDPGARRPTWPIAGQALWPVAGRAVEPIPSLLDGLIAGGPLLSTAMVNPTNPPSQTPSSEMEGNKDVRT